MPKDAALLSVHQTGEAGEEVLAEKGASAVDTFGGKVFVRWDPEAHVTGFGPAAYLIEFLKTNGLWERWVQRPRRCHGAFPRTSTPSAVPNHRYLNASNVAPSKRECILQSTYPFHPNVKA